MIEIVIWKKIVLYIDFLKWFLLPYHYVVNFGDYREVIWVSFKEQEKMGVHLDVGSTERKYRKVVDRHHIQWLCFDFSFPVVRKTWWGKKRPYGYDSVWKINKIAERESHAENK